MEKGPVCVTGASGFVGSHIVALLLEEGYSVRATVRSLSEPAKYSFLSGLPGADGKLTLAEGSLLEEGSYDTAVDECTAVIHVASPYFLHADDPQRELVDPAVKGTLNVLNACARADSVKRVIFTSSVTAITDEPVEGEIFTETDWNEKSSLTRNPYYYSKALAEKAAWAFVEENDVAFDLVVINPSAVIGPSLCPTLNTSNSFIGGLLNGEVPALYNTTYALVDVRDVAKAHLLALENPQASGRYICFNEALEMVEIADILREEGYGDQLPKFNLASPIGNYVVKLFAYTQPQGTRSFVHTHTGKRIAYDNSKIREELGIHFIPVEQSIRDTLVDLPYWGHL